MVDWRNRSWGAAFLALPALACGGKSEQAATSGSAGCLDSDCSMTSTGTSTGGANSSSTSGADGGAVATTGFPGVGGSPGVTGGFAGSTNVGGQSASGSGMGGSGGAGGQGAGGTGGGGWGGSGAGEGGSGGGDDDAYMPREGSFRALIFSDTKGFRSHGAIATGQQMFDKLAEDYGFEVQNTEETELFTDEGLADFELVVFLETSGDVLDSEEEEAFERWMTSSNGAFVGTLRSADTEYGWAFFDEVRGQYYESLTVQNLPNTIEWNDDALDFPAVRGLPSPWERAGLWFRLAEYPTWSTKPGFWILGTVDLTSSEDIIVSSAFAFVREHANFRSFYTGFGHDGTVFEDELVKQHIVGGLLWTVRREHWLD